MATTIVSTGELAAHLYDPDWIVIDCRHDLAHPDLGAAEYAKAHVPGARFFHLDRDLAGPRTGGNGRHPLPHPADFARKLGAAGVDGHRQIIAYDAQGGMCAARLWWMLRWLGHKRAAVLDGGWSRWRGEGGPVSAEIPSATPREFRPKPNDAWVDADFVLRTLGQVKLLDARSADRYRGENETIDPVAGRIPGSANRFYRDNLDSRGCFKAPLDLRREFDALLGEASQVVHYCGSGVSACDNLLAMEIAGLSGSRLYAGSWSEWSADSSRPIARGEPRLGEAPA